MRARPKKKNLYTLAERDQIITVFMVLAECLEILNFKWDFHRDNSSSVKWATLSRNLRGKNSLPCFSFSPLQRALSDFPFGPWHSFLGFYFKPFGLVLSCMGITFSQYGLSLSLPVGLCPILSGFTIKNKRFS